MEKDDILDIDDKTSFLDGKVEKVIIPSLDIISSKNDKVELPVDSSIPILTEVNGAPYPPDFMTMFNRIVNQYKKLPKVDYEKIYKEIAELTIRSCPTPTLQVLNQELQRVQAAKERVTEIMTDLLESFLLKKRAVDILKDSWIIFSFESSADKRKGDAAFRLSDFDMDFTQVEAVLKAATHIAKNLDSLQENLSRRITIFQLQLKLHDIGRGALPEINFENDIDNEFGIFNKTKTSNNDIPIGVGAESKNF